MCASNPGGGCGWTDAMLVHTKRAADPPVVTLRRINRNRERGWGAMFWAHCPNRSVLLSPTAGPGQPWSALVRPPSGRYALALSITPLASYWLDVLTSTL
jgi:hypothetical protein